MAGLHRLPRRHAACLLACGLLGMATVQAQTLDAGGSGADGGEGTKRLGMTVVPRIGVSETWTDNLTLAPDGQRDRALITSVSPGLSITSRSGWLRGTLDYQMDGLLYLKSDRSSRVQNQLQARGNAELVQSRLFVDANANISQQTISAFGQSSPSGELDNPNRTEVRTLTVSPYWRGMLSTLASFELRATGQMRDSSEGGAGASSASGDTKEGSLNLSLSGPQGRALNWGLQAYTRRIHYELTGLDNRSSSAVATLSWIPDVDWVLGVSGGREKSDYFGNDTSSIYGASLKWTPTPRTTLSGDWQRHSYGNSHNAVLEHRMTQLVLRLTSTQSVSTGSDPSGQMTNYQLLDLQYSSIEPDAAKRDALVRSLLAALGLSPSAISSTGFLTNTATLQQRNELALAWTSPRMTLTLAANDNKSRALGTTANATDDLALASNIRQRGVTLSVAYRFTPLSTGNVTYTRQHSSGDGSGNALSNGMSSLTASTTHRLGPRTDASLGLRHTRSDDQSLGYRENAIYAQMTQRF
ncbi:TIGR03016 family PEP-CTERM system-associated outer membrane protein [Roseateles terrae]|uniref:Uncharacterized protein (PEP-CTERM system associated) n=1 Tax=Roseateles terrae TaxID=431060 RepID=A0ABR6GWW7_9BURK|nr:TIGR03016 family PEP-CTERM system-associated outer membrane protein [Roseateles terrae]MBB3196605.1 uncharacterized protein (PEP-CTERM system associated) [Roseateles terrae]OWQ84863.1 TIGR03016 family PEP-CTERM system-associated outer membrane protein [Roseateles terrae]